MAVVGVVCAVLFAPEKPEAPPASEISYDEKPAPPARDNRLRADGPRRERRPRPQAPVKAPVAEAPAPDPERAIRGTVKDAKTGEAVVKALVVCTRPATELAEALKDAAGGEKAKKPNAEFKTHTNRQGRYVLGVDQAATYRVSVSRTGYVPIKERECVMTEEQKEVRLDFTLSTGASISGRVSEAGSGKGAEGVTVRLKGAGASSNTRTDPDGQYTLSGLVEGDYSVTLDLRKAAYLARGVAPARNVTVARDGQEVTGIDFTLEAAGEVWGYVMTRDREPLQHVDVLLCSSASMASQAIEAGIKQQPPLHNRSDEQGYFELIGVPLNEEWRLYSMTNKLTPQLSAPFVLTNTRRTAHVDMFLAEGSNVYGRVVSEAGGAIPNAEVFCLPFYGTFFSPMNAPQAVRGLSSKDDGTFVVPHLPVGDYQVMARKKGFKFAAVGEAIYPDGYNDIHNVEVVLTPITEGEHTVYGTVREALGAPIEGAKVTLGAMGTEDFETDTKETDTDAQGRYAFKGVAAGLLMVAAEKAGYQPQTVNDVRLNEPTDIVLEASALVSGVVLIRETGAAPEQFTVHAMHTTLGGPAPLARMLEGRYRDTFTGGDGRFTLEVAPGEYTIEARAPGLTPGRSDVAVGPGEELDGITIYMRQEGGRIEGQVRTADSASPQGALVWLEGGSDAAEALASLRPPSEQGGVQVGADGAFAFADLQQGLYTVLARLEGYAQASSGPLSLSEGQNLTGIDLVLEGGGVLAGYVMFSGRLEAGAIVTVVGNSVTEMTTADDNGEYRISNLPTGSFLASALSLSGAVMLGQVPSLHARIEIVEGQTTTYNFGEPTNTAMVGFCVPAPPPGTLAQAVLLLPGAPEDVAGLDFMNPATWFQNLSTSTSYVLASSQIDADGFFRLDNLAPGEFLLQVYYSSMAELMTGTGRNVFSDIVTIVDGETIEMDVPIPPG